MFNTIDLKTQLNRRILLVDDEPEILDELTTVLSPKQTDETTGRELNSLENRLFGEPVNIKRTQKSYEVHCCRQGNDAVNAVQQALTNDRPFAVAFLDVRMPPGPDGVRTAEQIRKIDPNLQIVMMTGYSDFDISEIAKRVPPEDKLLYVQKPIHSQEIRQFALALTAKWQSDTLLRLQNEYLARVNEKLTEHDHLKSEFVTTVSHELRTPLTIFKNIISNAMAGVMGKIPPKLRHNLEIADEAINRLAAIINDFLDISKLEVGRMKLKPEVLCVQKVISDSTEMLRFVTESKDIRLDVFLPDEDIYIYADAEKFARVINNIIENATKFVPQKTGHIKVWVEMDGTDRICISIADNGPGIHGDNKKKVFDKFVQVEKHIGPGKHGTGLGLAICRDLVHLHSGHIWIEDNTGGGAVFKILLPAYNTAEHPQIETAEQGVMV